MDVEKIATRAVSTSISKTDLLSEFISSGDKEPCWDGAIYIHEDEKHKKTNIRRVSAQVKGKVVNRNKVKEHIKYSVSYDDLHAYMINGGSVFFVVYIDKDTRDPLQIYYAELLPIKVQTFLEKKQSSYSIRFKKFPSDNLQKTEILYNFFENSKKQLSFAGKKTPTLEELKNANILESVSFSYTGFGANLSNTDFPRVIDGKSLTLYANIKGCDTPVPIEYYDSVHKVTMSCDQKTAVKVGDVEYYSTCKRTITADNETIEIGSCVKLTISNNDKESGNYRFKITMSEQGTLNERIQGLEFMLAIINCGFFSYGAYLFPVEFGDNEKETLNKNKWPEKLVEYKKIKQLLDALNVTKDLDIANCSEKDYINLHMLTETILKNKRVKSLPEEGIQQCILSIANLNLAFVYLKNDHGGYNVWNYFGEHFAVEWRSNNGDSYRISQFITMKAEDYLRVDNLNLDFVVEDYKALEPTTLLVEFCNNTILELIKAYDLSKKICFLHTAKELEDLIEKAPDADAMVCAINRLQIAFRERDLTFEEKSELFSIISNTENALYRIGAFLLLNEQQKAKTELELLSPAQMKVFKTYPIFNLYHLDSTTEQQESVESVQNCIEEAVDNGQTENAQCE